MTMDKDPLLSPQEVDALLNVMADGGADSRERNTQAFDLADQNRPLGSRLPMFSMIHERFARGLNATIDSMLRRQSRVEMAGASVVCFGDYQHSLATPAFINFIQIKPLRGTALVVLDARLVVALVDHFFGGSGQVDGGKSGGDFTPIEKRLAHLLLQRAFADLRQAWSSVLAVDFECVRTETQAEFANVLNPSEPMLLTTFAIQVEGTAGRFQIAIPSAMLEPVRRQLETTYPAEESAADSRWRQVLSEEIEGVRVHLSSTLTRTELPLSQVLALEAGDVIAIEMPDQVTLNVEGVPLFRGEYGAANGRNAVKLCSRVARPGIAK